ncbi:uncharacterized protein [Salminus brasiliensis]|uniref:uncharacterized protein n=1 Tax=Salminus brasiliensis TaxID=930266 RepID=UPI003B82F460
MNVYEDTAPGSRIEMSAFEKTEDVYQTLHKPPAERNAHSEHGAARGSRFKTVLVVFNTLLLIIILILVGLRTKSAAETKQNEEADEPRVAGSNEDRELWRFHDDVFYLFWEAEGNCSEAQTFCEERSSRIGSVTLENKDWILSRVKGKKLWMNTARFLTEHLNETLPQCPLREEASGSPVTAQGWVCAYGQYFFDWSDLFEHYSHDITPHETDAPEYSEYSEYSITSSAGRVLSVYVIIVSVLILL